MKKIRFLLALLPLAGLTSCLEILEDVTVNENGSGNYMVSVEAGAMMNMVMSMGGDKDPAMAEKLKEKKDTSFALLSTLKPDSVATPEEMELFKNSTIHLKMDVENSVFTMETRHPFTTAANFNKLKSALAAFNKKADNPMDKIMGGGDKGEEEENPMSGLSGFGGEGFNLVLNDNSITRTLNQAKLDELGKMPEMEGMDDQSKSMFEAIKYKTVFHLPRAATVADSKIMVVSEDRKMVSFENNLLQLFEEPKSFVFTINY
jgi:hypothetical protein